MSSSDVTTQEPANHEARPDLAGWLVIGTIGTAALCLAWVYAPQRLKLPLLTPLALGMIVGWGLGQWAAAREVRSGRLVFAVTSLLIAAGLVGGTVETYRVGSRQIRMTLDEKSSMADAIDQAMIEAAEDDRQRAQLQAEHDDAHRRRAEEAVRRQHLVTFPGYLESRIPLQWGRWQPPWALAFFLGETALASLLGGWTARRTIVANANVPIR